MTAPGWYEAEGDPPGTQRYWDGSVWIGHPVYEPEPSPLPPSPQVPPPSRYTAPFPAALKAVAVALSIIKAIPLAFVAILLIWIASVSNTIDDEFDEFDEFNFEGLLDAAVAVLAIILVIGLVLLVLQFVGAIREKPMMVFIPALIMSIGDGLLAFGSWVSFAEAQTGGVSNDSIGGVMLITIVAGAQIFIAVQAIRAHSR